MTDLTGLTVSAARKILASQGMDSILFRPVLPPRDVPEEPGDRYRVLLAKTNEVGSVVLTVCKPVEAKGIEPDERQ
jgi:hypothetical protein